MLTLRKREERGHANHGWLDTYHTFSFADYYDPAHMGFRDLRVINEDVVASGRGFSTHGHRDMEIVTVVLSGGLRHKDSMGNGEVIHPGEVQRMSAGKGILHSEHNASDREPVHLYQIWLQPREAGGAPSYEQKPYHDDELRDRLLPIVTPTGADGAVSIGQDVRLLRGLLGAGTAVTHAIAPGRHAWVQVARGVVEVSTSTGDKVTLRAGDGLAVSDESMVTLTGAEDADVLVFDLR
ncbi:MAG: pirin family protein [Planctomycetota bacterium]